MNSVLHIAFASALCVPFNVVSYTYVLTWSNICITKCDLTSAALNLINYRLARISTGHANFFFFAVSTHLIVGFCYSFNKKISPHLGKETKWGIYRRVGGKIHSSIATNRFSLSCLSRWWLDERVEESWPLICHVVTLVCCFQNASHAARCWWQKCPCCCQSQVFSLSFCKTLNKIQLHCLRSIIQHQPL